MTGEKTVALTGGSGTMGFQGFLELYSHAEEFDIRLLLRDSQKNRKKFAKYMDDPAVKIVWGDLTKYADVLEWATVEDLGRLLRKVCGDDIPEEFWRRFYNIGSGRSYRLTNFQFEELILRTLGLGGTKALFQPNWFTTRNFHGQYFVDSDVLEGYCHFRANIPVEEYFRGLLKQVEFYFRLAFLGRPWAPLMKRFWMKSIAETPVYGTLWWAKNHDKARMNAFYGGQADFEQLPTRWEDFELQFPDTNTDSLQVRILDHGYDESKPFESLTLEDLQKAAAFRGGRWCPDELPWPWDYDEEARRNPFFAQVWHAVHDPSEQNTYGPEIFDEFPEKVTE